MTASQQSTRRSRGVPGSESGAAPSHRTPRRRWLGLGLGLGLGLLAARAVGNIYRYRIREFRLSLDGLRAPLHLLQLSDLHFGLYLRGGSVSRWVETAVALTPDLVVITGDFVQGRPTIDPEPLAELLAGLEAPLGVWGVWGNHDHAWYTSRPHRLASVLERAGVRILENRGVRLRDDLYLAGIDDESTGSPDVSRALREAPGDGVTLLLCHRPESAQRVPSWVDLVVAGHTHGGQVRLPGPPSLPYGWQGERPRLYVSSGLGVGLLPLRLNCPPELVSFRLEPG